MQKAFTFAMLTYNQEKYVIEQMESIRYQIQCYGKEYKNYFLISDDASSDHTVAIVKKWLEQHDIFDGVKIIVAPQNGGIVKNYTTAIKNIETDRFKLLAGDDLYYKNNIYKITEKADFVITPTLKLNEKGIFSAIFQGGFRRLLAAKGDIKEFLMDELKNGNPLEAPGVFWNHAYAGEELYHALSPYKWIEDVVCYHFLLGKEELSVYLTKKPYILYRIDSGISFNRKHSFQESYLKEVEVLEQKFFVNRHRKLRNFNKILFPYRIWIKKVYCYMLCQLDTIKSKIGSRKKQELRNAKRYYAEIKRRVAQWETEYKL